MKKRQKKKRAKATLYDRATASLYRRTEVGPIKFDNKNFGVVVIDIE